MAPVLLTEDQTRIRDLARSFARTEIAPHAAAWERAGGPPRDLYRRMAGIGLMGMLVDPRWGGSGTDFTSYALAIEEVSAADGGISNVMAATNSPVAAAIDRHGTEQHRRDYLTRLTTGEWIGSIHLTEPHTGSDASAITTRAVRDGDEWVLSGTKAFITAGSLSDVAMIVAVTEPGAGKRGISCFVTPTDNPGYRILAREDKLGHRTNDTCQVAFDDMRIPATDLLGQEGRGLAIALGNLSLGRIAVAAQAVGGARSALVAARDYARERETFGRPIVEHQAVAFKLADMATRVEAARQLYLHAAARHDAGLACTREASMAKLFASEMAERVASDAIQIHGGAGYLADHPVEKIYRDVRVYQIYEGTSEVQRIVISRDLDGIEG